MKFPPPSPRYVIFCNDGIGQTPRFTFTQLCVHMYVCMYCVWCYVYIRIFVYSSSNATKVFLHLHGDSSSATDLHGDSSSATAAALVTDGGPFHCCGRHCPAVCRSNRRGVEQPHPPPWAREHPHGNGGPSTEFRLREPDPPSPSPSYHCCFCCFCCC